MPDEGIGGQASIPSIPSAELDAELEALEADLASSQLNGPQPTHNAKSAPNANGQAAGKAASPSDNLEKEARGATPVGTTSPDGVSASADRREAGHGAEAQAVQASGATDEAPTAVARVEAVQEPEGGAGPAAGAVARAPRPDWPLCVNFYASGSCPRGDACKFAHGLLCQVLLRAQCV